jgi:hypothetical protein
MIPPSDAELNRTVHHSATGWRILPNVSRNLLYRAGDPTLTG